VKDVVRLGLVGCGRLAEAGYLPALALRGTRGGDDLRLVAVADPDPIRRERVAARAGRLGRGPVSTHRDAASLLEGTEVDAVVIASPVGAHLGDASAAAAAGVPALVEKPPAGDAAGARALAALRPAPWVGFNRRFDAGARAARDAVPPTGRVDLRLELSYRRTGWGAAVVRDDALTDLGPHLVDWARWLTGDDVLDVVAVEVAQERASLELALARGRARLLAATDRPHHELVEVADPSGAVLARHRLGGPVAGVRGRLAGRGADVLVATLAAQLDALATAVRGAAPPDLGTAADGVAVMEAIDAARASAAGGGRVVRVGAAVAPGTRR
jgi:predicted dehydrogenase